MRQKKNHFSWASPYPHLSARMNAEPGSLTISRISGESDSDGTTALGTAV